MEPAINYESFIRRVKRKYDDETQIVAVLFARYGIEVSNKLINESLEYLNINTGKSLDIYMAGYGQYKFSSEHLEVGERLVKLEENKTGWYFSINDFIDLKRNLEEVSKWEYNDEVEVVFFNYSNNRLDLSRFLSVNLERAQEAKKISSSRAFFETVTRIINRGAYNINTLSNNLLITYGKENLLDFIWDSIPGGLGKYGKQLADFSVRK